MKNTIEKVLRGYKKKERTSEELRPSAVLVPVFCKEKECYVLFTRRSRSLVFHRGQVCFPGGAPEPDDSSLLQTALREAKEEIGLGPEDVEIVGELDDSCTLSSGYIISPFVAFIPHPYPFTLNYNEVEGIFSIPLSALLDENTFRQGYYPAENRTGPGYAYEYEGNIIWGATARILKQLIELLRSEIESGALD